MAYPTLRSNEIYSALYNMIISQTVFADNFSGLDDGFVSKFRVDGSMYGDTKLYYSADILNSVAWVQDQTSGTDFTNVLALHRAPAPDCQAITFDNFRQIALTLDDYMSKRAWGTEGAFAQFNSVLMAMVGETKKVYDYLTLATFIGSDVSSTGSQAQSLTIAAGTADEKRAKMIAQKIADILVDVKRPSRNYNDHQNMRSVDPKDLLVIWNSDYVNEIRKVDLPGIFHAEGLMDKFAEETLPGEYFGEAIVDATALAKYSASTPAAGKPINSSTGAYTPGTNHANGCVRALVEKTVGSTHYFPGDEITANETVKASGGNWGLNEVYVELPKTICKIIHKRSVPFMSAFEVGTSFFNARNLSTNHYLTWGYNTLQHLKNYPYITVTEA